MEWVLALLFFAGLLAIFGLAAAAVFWFVEERQYHPRFGIYSHETDLDYLRAQLAKNNETWGGDSNKLSRRKAIIRRIQYLSKREGTLEPGEFSI